MCFGFFVVMLGCSKYIEFRTHAVCTLAADTGI